MRVGVANGFIEAVQRSEHVVQADRVGQKDDQAEA
jgi:hypothetical protein